MPDQTREVGCPFCAAQLYRVGSIAPLVNGLVQGGAELDRDDSGPFMRCPHCKSRVAMEETRTPLGLAAFCIAPGQGSRK